MSVNQQGFSLVEVLIAMTIGSILLLATARFLPALQGAILRQTQQQVLEEEIWQRLFTVSRHLQRAGFCRGACGGEAVLIENQCLRVRWDSNLNGVWEDAPAANSDVTGFRLKNGALETLRGATDCNAKGWDKMTDPDFLIVDEFKVQRHNISGFSPEFEVTLSAHLKSRPTVQLNASHSVTGHNL
ncbi:prepilin peptidase-dependent protein [Scandinavium sp. TWS1a]|uniref:prepilin peptidase-dependent protein n=1 Tax=Scandinavium tedordense TaxID=2926521 RepID=UPI00135B2331|nr:prepilin peptidase-dependent protein [Scandinavium tedordense]MCS2169294.1 prepilin peptidase-dependent protein [Scandinavium tedordense]